MKLGFVIGSHLLKEEMCDVLGNKKLMSEEGYLGLNSNDSLKNAFKEGWIAPPSRSLVIWKSGVVHFEATSKKSNKKGNPFVFSGNSFILQFLFLLFLPSSSSSSQVIE